MELRGGGVEFVYASDDFSEKLATYLAIHKIEIKIGKQTDKQNEDFSNSPPERLLSVDPKSLPSYRSRKGCHRHPQVFHSRMPHYRRLSPQSLVVFVVVMWLHSTQVPREPFQLSER